MIESRIELIRHFVSESGISQGGNMNLWGDAWRDQLTVEAGYSISPDSQPVLVDPATIEVVTGNTNNVFSDIQQVILPIPGLQVGSNATVIGSRRFQSADLPLDWSSITVLRSNVPIKRIELEVSREADAPEFMWQSNDEELECTGDDRHLSCSRSNIPAIQPDPNVMSYVDLMPHFFVGAALTWSGLQEKVAAMIESSAALTPALREKVQELGLDPADSHKRKLWKLFRFAADEIRYVSLSHGDATVVPHPASLTLSRRYGDCKDKVTMLVAMGRAAGLDIFPVLTSSDRKDRAKVLRPSSNYFDHMIACMFDEQGERVCVDPTQAYSGLELPPHLFDAISLPIGRSLEPKLDNLTRQAFGWQIHLQRDLTLQADGSLSLRDVRRYSGPGSALYRTQILALSRADRDARVGREYRESHGGSSAPNFTFRSLTDAATPFEIEFSTQSPAEFQLAEGEFYRFDPWLIFYARGMISTNKHHPYVLLGFRYSSEETFAHCCGNIDFAGPDLTFESKFGSLQRSSEIIDGNLTIKTVFEIPTTVIPPEEITQFESFILESTAETTQWISWRLHE
ncbi:MAG: DUF3857 domain-containing transglutaminase family protein [bacterium]|nr:DUF3857 domain-containing transglutaminase family protein [bacterium]